MQELSEDNRKRKVTEIFDELRAAGKSEEEIFGEAVEGLKQLARKMINRQHAGDSLHATRLVNEVYVKLFNQPASEFRWETGDEFFLVVARAMHDLKVDYIRRKLAAKRGGGKLESLDALTERLGDAVGAPGIFEDQARDAYKLDQALRRLREEFPEQEKAIVLRALGNDHSKKLLPYAEIAKLLKVDVDRVHYLLATARRRLKLYLILDEPPAH